MKHLGEDWQQLPIDTRKEYPIFGHKSPNMKRKLGDEIIPSNEVWKKNKRRLIENVQQMVTTLLCRLTSGS
jgi:hypothetical protein